MSSPVGDHPPNISPHAQAKRVLEAHLEESQRRLVEASELGTALVQNRQNLSEHLREVEAEQGEGEIGADLQRKLESVEKEYNEVGRQSERAFLAQKRLVSTSDENGVGTPSLDNRSILYSAQAMGSPSNMTRPSRKQRSQPGNNIRDAEFHADLSTALLGQVRQLQTLLTERDETLKAVNLERSRLEMEADGYAQRIRALEENEERYKDENWSLETQTHELMGTIRDSTEREGKLNSNISLITEEKNAVERELEDAKQSNAKLIEDQVAIQKPLDAEIILLRRSLNEGDADKRKLQHELDESVSRNEELALAAKTMAARYRETEAAREISPDDTEDVQELSTPEHSPPASPVKPTPRHNHLEAETLRSSLGHSHRMYQSLKSAMHREKTEKIELRRMLQETRDEVDQLRHDSISGAASSKRRKGKSDALRKPPRSDLLGAGRKGMAQVDFEETDWEDSSPHRAGPFRQSSKTRKGVPVPDLPGGSYQTDTEDAFETATERGTTDSEAFETGQESMADDSTDSSDTEKLSESETESPSRKVPYSMFKRARLSGEAPLASRSRASSEREETPSSDVGQEPRATEGQSLFAELAELSSPGSEDEFAPSMRDNTPSRTSTPRMSDANDSRRPSVVRKAVMVDTGVMTEPLESENAAHFAPGATVAAFAGAAGASLASHFTKSGSTTDDEHVSASSNDPRNAESLNRGIPTADIVPERNLSAIHEQQTKPVEATPLELGVSVVSSSPTEPKLAAPVELVLTAIGSQHTKPEEAAPVELNFSSICSEDTEPAHALPVQLGLYSPNAEFTEPEHARLLELGISDINTHHHAEPDHAKPFELGISAINTHHHAEPDHAKPFELGISSFDSHHTKPQHARMLELGVSPVNIHHHVEPDHAKPRELGISAINTHHHAEPGHARPFELGVSSINTHHHAEPSHAKPFELGISALNTHHHAEPSHAKPFELGVSAVNTHHHAEPSHAKPFELGVSSVNTHHHAEPSHARPFELGVSAINTHHHAEPGHARPFEFGVSDINTHHHAEPSHARPFELALSAINTHHHAEPDHAKPFELAVSAINTHHHAQPGHARPFELGVSSINTHHHSEPGHARPFELGVSDINTHHHAEPSHAKPFELGVSAVNTHHHAEPGHARPFELGVSAINTHHHAEPGHARPFELGVSDINTHHHAEPGHARPFELGISDIGAQYAEPEHAKPLELEISGIGAQYAEPEHAKPLEFGISDIGSQSAEPEHPKLLELGISSMSSQHAEPQRAIPTQMATSSLMVSHTEPAAPSNHHSISGMLAGAAAALGGSAVASHLAQSKAPESSLPGTGTEPAEQSPLSNGKASRGLEASKSRDLQSTDPSISTGTEARTAETQSSERRVPELSLSSVHSENITPVIPVLPEREFLVSSVSSQYSEPLKAKPKLPELSVSSVPLINTKPATPTIPELSVSSVPLVNTEPVAPAVPKLSVSSVPLVSTQPTAPTVLELGLSSISSQKVQPAKPAVKLPSKSSVFSESTEPVLMKNPEVNIHVSRVHSESTGPVAPEANGQSILSAFLPFNSGKQTRESPANHEQQTDGQADKAAAEVSNGTGSETPVPGVSRDDPSALDNASDKSAVAGLPLAPVSGNASQRSTKGLGKVHAQADQGAQTTLSSKQIDSILMDLPSSTPKAKVSKETMHPSASNKNNSLRPGSSGSHASFVTGRQTLADGDEKKESDQSRSAPGLMGPPLAPASALRANAPSSDHSSQVGFGRQPSFMGKGKQAGQLSRKSSATSFASELEERFNMLPGADSTPYNYSYSPGTDPRIVQAITQTMIGEYLWKYTRRPVTGDMSSSRHRRYFWVHPYTRSLYWSVQDPQTVGKHEMKAKSVPIEAIRVVNDDNPYPPGLHHQSLEVISPGRRVRFTATTSQRHDTWVNALSYLLLRNPEGENGEENEGNVTLEDIDEFNVGLLSNPQPQGRTSLSSYSRSSRSVLKPGRPAVASGRGSPVRNTWTQGATIASERPRSVSRYSSFMHPGAKGSIPSRKARYDDSIAEPASLEDLRYHYNGRGHEHDPDRLENVRACCDGTSADEDHTCE